MHVKIKIEIEKERQFRSIDEPRVACLLENGKRKNLNIYNSRRKG